VSLMSSTVNSQPVMTTGVMSDDELIKEWVKCSRDPAYFIHTYCWIYDPVSREWIRFRLWLEQYQVVQSFIEHQLHAWLKARQIGLTWIALALGLWQMIFQAIATVLLFSKRDDEAVYLLSDERMRGMYRRLPDWMKWDTDTSNDHVWKLANGSTARAFPTTAGDSYSGTYAVVDEADLVPNLGRLLNSVKPTIDAGGKLLLISRADKSQPQSLFKAIYRGGRRGLNGYSSVFLPWHVHPSRDEAWYRMQRIATLENTGSLDDLHEQYPATDEEAMAPREQDKRIPPNWIDQCYIPMRPMVLPTDAPTIPGLKVYALPEAGREYVAGMDCAEGLVKSDDSVTQMLDRRTGEQVAVFAAKLTPAVHAAYSEKLCQWYNNAAIMPERNNHGHAAILWFDENSSIGVLTGQSDRPGWNNNTQGKVLMYDDLAEDFKDSGLIIHDEVTYQQIRSIEMATLRAPEQMHDDYADALGVANQGRRIPQGIGFY